MDVASHTPVFVFDGFSLDPSHRLLMRGGEAVPLHPKAFELLTMLVENSDRVLTKNELLNSIWESQFVEENNLAVQVSALRKVFGEKSGENRFIATVPGRGYQFVADVRVSNGRVREPARNNGQPLTPVPETIRLIDYGEDRSWELPIRSALPYFAGLVFIAVAASAFLFWWKSSPSPRQWKLTKQTATGNVTNATISGDGKFIVFSQTEGVGESLWLRQIDTGSQTRIIAPDALEYVGLSISPGNNFIYFSTFGANRASTPLQRIPLLGGAPQHVGWVESGVAVSFSPDGRQFAYTEGSSSLRESYLKIAQADGADPRTLVRAKDGERTIQDHKVHPAAWSPSGSEIALAVSEKTGDGAKAGILLVDANGGVERFILRPRFEFIHSLAWLDRDNLAFVATEFDEPTSQIWTIPIASGDPRRVTNDLQDYLWISASLDGELLTVQKNADSSLNIAAIDAKDQLLRPREIVHETELLAVAIAPGGEILYTSRATGSREIWSVSRDGGDPKQITVDGNILKGIAVSPKNGSLVFSSTRTGKPGLWIAGRDGSNYRRLTEGEDVFPQFTPDGGSVVFQRGSSDFPTLWRVRAEPGSEPVQLVSSHSVVPTLSPDGSQLAYYFMDFKSDGAWRIGIASAGNGELVGKLSFPTPVSERRMSWHPAGRFLGQIVNSGETASLLLLPTDGGNARTISGLGNGRVNSVAWSEDGKTLVYSITLETQDVVSIGSEQ
jgi:DNA-binding winged helix-turn-helix (wHTH) protein/Tol biopolymer transport system component